MLAALFTLVNPTTDYTGTFPVKTGTPMMVPAVWTVFYKNKIKPSIMQLSKINSVDAPSKLW
jgi:hypothetical protein